MEKRKKLDQRSRSAPCVNDRAGRVHASAERSERTGRVHASKGSRTVRICFAVMTISLLLFSMVASASALMVDGQQTTSATILRGNCQLKLFGTPEDVSSDDLLVNFPVGGYLPWFNTTAVNDTVSNTTLFLPLDDAFYFQQNHKLARRVKNIDFGSAILQMDSYRNLVTHTITDSYGETTKAEYIIAKFDFEPCFMPILNESLLKNLLVINTADSLSVSTSVTYSYVDVSGEIVTRNGVFLNSILLTSSEGSKSASALPSRLVSQIMADMNGFSSGVGLFIEDLVITITPVGPEGSVSISGMSFDLLADRWGVGSAPIYFVENPVSVWLEEVKNYLEGTGGGIPEYPTVDEGPFMTFIVNSVGAFFDAEIMPGFSIGGVFSVVFMIVVIILILKFFAGG